MNNESLLAARLPAQALATVATPEVGAVSWPAIVAGATGAAALSLILLILGTGLGLSSVSPWSDRGASGTALGVSTIVWITLTQVAAAGMGGYIAGRLRVRWADTHADEVFFRDTAHGFLAWALATLVTAAMLTSAISNIVGGGVKAGAVVAGTTAATAVAALPMAGSMTPDGAENSSRYEVDTMFRKDPGSSSAATAPPTADQALVPAEVTRVLTNGLATGTLGSDDTKYLGQLVAQRTGLPQTDAEKRVTDGFTRIQAKAKEAEATARDTADKTRKASAYAALWLFVSLLVGAFCASLAATFGGRRRDHF